MISNKKTLWSSFFCEDCSGSGSSNRPREGSSGVFYPCLTCSGRRFDCNKYKGYSLYYIDEQHKIRHEELLQLSCMPYDDIYYSPAWYILSSIKKDMAVFVGRPTGIEVESLIKASLAWSSGEQKLCRIAVSLFNREVDAGLVDLYGLSENNFFLAISAILAHHRKIGLV